MIITSQTSLTLHTLFDDGNMSNLDIHSSYKSDYYKSSDVSDNDAYNNYTRNNSKHNNNNKGLKVKKDRKLPKYLSHQSLIDIELDVKIMNIKEEYNAKIKKLKKDLRRKSMQIIELNDNIDTLFMNIRKYEKIIEDKDKQIEALTQGNGGNIDTRERQETYDIPDVHEQLPAPGMPQEMNGNNIFKDIGHISKNDSNNINDANLETRNREMTYDDIPKKYKTINSSTHINGNVTSNESFSGLISNNIETRNREMTYSDIPSKYKIPNGNHNHINGSNGNSNIYNNNNNNDNNEDVKVTENINSIDTQNVSTRNRQMTYDDIPTKYKLTTNVDSPGLTVKTGNDKRRIRRDTYEDIPLKYKGKKHIKRSQSSYNFGDKMGFNDKKQKYFVNLDDIKTRDRNETIDDIPNKWRNHGKYYKPNFSNGKVTLFTQPTNHINYNYNTGHNINKNDTIDDMSIKYNNNKIDYRKRTETIDDVPDKWKKIIK